MNKPVVIRENMRHTSVGPFTRRAGFEYLRAENQALGEQLGNRRRLLKQTRTLILDRDPLTTRAFREMLKEAGVNVARLPSRSPNLNCFAERWVRSVRPECLSRVIPLGERHLRHLLAEYVTHYHQERNHQGLGNRLIEPTPAHTNGGEGVVRRCERLGGLLNYYHRKAA